MASAPSEEILAQILAKLDSLTVANAILQSKVRYPIGDIMAVVDIVVDLDFTR